MPRPDAAPVKVRPKLPEHLRKRFRPGGPARDVERRVEEGMLHTVCQSAHCPNRNECFGGGTATFLLMGNLCSRHCPFCAIGNAKQLPPLDWDEPRRLLRTVRAMDLRFVVLTSVNRDDLELGGADLFAECIRLLREEIEGIRIEVLTPDFLGRDEAIRLVIEARPDVFNHNVETVPSLYRRVRPEGEYQRSLALLEQVKRENPDIPTKSGLMVGLGESPEEVLALFDDLRAVDCDFLTVGQYLAPSQERHLPVKEFVQPERFEHYRQEALARGFRFVASGPFVRSSYMAHQALDVPVHTR